MTLRADVAVTDTRLMPDHPFSPSSHRDEQAWVNISSTQYVWLTESEVVDLGVDPEVAVRTSIPSRPNEHGYAASVAALHLLHCLTAVRFHMKTGPVWSEVTEDEQGHLQHCTEAIRQALVCAASTDVTPFVWYDDGWLSDLWVKDKCGNFDGITQWAEQRKMDMNPFRTEMPRGQKCRNSTDLVQRQRLWY